MDDKSQTTNETSRYRFRKGFWGKAILQRITWVQTSVGGWAYGWHDVPFEDYMKDMKFEINKVTVP